MSNHRASIRIAFIGVGRMAHLHAGHIEQEPGVAIVAAADSNGVQATAFAHQ